MSVLECAFSDCGHDVTHIDRNGFTLCAKHAEIAKRNGRRNRKLRAWECNLLRANLPVTYELRPRSAPSSGRSE